MKIDQKLLDELTAEAKANPRHRMHYDLRDSEEEMSMRMLNAIEPETVIPIHRHADTSEDVIVLRGEAVEYTAKGFHLNTKHINQKKRAIINMYTLLKSYDEYCNGTLLDLLNKLREIDDSIPKVSRGSVLEAYQKPYADYAKSVNYTDDNTYFITIHKSKGLGFDNVLLVFPEKEVGLAFLLNTDLTQADDEHRLYYVACSRARNRLFINLPSIDEKEKALLKTRFGDVVNID